MIGVSSGGKIRIGAKLKKAQFGYVKSRTYLMADKSVDLMMPLTGNIPLIASREEYRLIKRSHERFQCAGSPKWGLVFRQGSFNMTAGAKHFRSREMSLPLYEAKYVHQYNHRFADFRHRDASKNLGVHPSCDRLSFRIELRPRITPRFSITHESEYARQIVENGTW